MFQCFESSTFAILLNSFYFSIFVFMEMLLGLICTCVCHKICTIEDITNFHGSLTFRMVKMFQYFKTPIYAILLNHFYFSIFAFMEMLWGLICTWVYHKMCRIEDITNFHCSLVLSSKENS